MEKNKSIALFIGNLLEHYDAALFGFLSPFLAPFLFPHHDPLVALILTFAITPLGMLSRPIGALVFGYIGDRIGRERALFFTLSGMSIVSFFLMLTPPYSKVGILAPLYFMVGRILQNFFTGGETIGGAICLLEKLHEKKKTFFSSLYDTSTIGGLLLASLGVWIVTHIFKDGQGWRLLYLLGCTLQARGPGTSL